MIRYWLVAWVTFNATLALLMGVYHQGGVVPAQTWLGQQKNLTANLSEVLWWRTYSPPIWLLDHNPLQTTDLMGIPLPTLQRHIEASLGPDCDPDRTIGLVAPFSSVQSDTILSTDNLGLELEEMWRYSRHLNLDDMDFAGDGFWGALTRVVERRGLVVWRVKKKCIETGARMMQGDW